MDKNALRGVKFPYIVCETLDETILRNANVVSLSRWQKERIPKEEWYKFEGVNATMMTEEKAEIIDSNGGIILHALPRLEELPLSVDAYDAAVYWNQSEYGRYIAMAVLKHYLVDL